MLHQRNTETDGADCSTNASVRNKIVISTRYSLPLLGTADTKCLKCRSYVGARSVPAESPDFESPVFESPDSQPSPDTGGTKFLKCRSYVGAHSVPAESPVPIGCQTLPLGSASSSLVLLSLAYADRNPS